MSVIFRPHSEDVSVGVRDLVDRLSAADRPSASLYLEVSQFALHQLLSASLDWDEFEWLQEEICNGLWYVLAEIKAAQPDPSLPMKPVL